MKTTANTIRLLVLKLLCAVVFAAVIAIPAFPAPCAFEPQGEGRVSAIVDARTFTLEDGREVRLAAIEAATEGTAALAALVANQFVTLRNDSDAPDRYGRQAAFVFAEGSERSVQRLLLERGEALASGTLADKACAAELAAAERLARQAGRGVWAHRTVIKNAESGDDILARVGQFTVVEGKVVSVRQAGATTYINFGRRWTRDFAVTISRRALAMVENAGISLKALENQRIRVRGWVEARGQPRIEVLRAGQIEMAGPDQAGLSGGR